MRVKDLCYDSLISLSVHKWRTALAMLGIAIGIGGISLITIFTDSIGATIKEEITTFGIHNVAIYQSSQVETQFSLNQKPALLYSDINHVKAMNLPISDITPIIKKYFRASHNLKHIKSSVYFTTPAFERISQETLASGRFITEYDMSYGRAVCVIDETIQGQLFGNKSAIGKKIDLNGDIFTVIGVIKPKVRKLIDWIEQRATRPSRIFIPLSYQLNKLSVKNIERLVVTVNDTKDIDMVGNRVIYMLEKEHPGRSYKYSSRIREIHSFNSILFHLRWVFYMTIGIALLVGGIGVANVMTISVLERTKEIGIRKACGASSQHIFSQFLLESVLVCVFSGFLGASFGSFLGYFIMSIYGDLVVISFFKIFITFFITVTVGILSGLIPAMRASQLSIVDAIRYET